MASVAVLASGSGSNFEAIAKAISATTHHVCCLICDRHNAGAFDRARRLGIRSHYVSYAGRDRREAERDIESVLDSYQPELIALAGFMRVLTPSFVDTYEKKIVNIHPALLPAHPGAHGLEESYRSGDTRVGITIHYVDHGTDTGPIIRQAAIDRDPDEALESLEQRIHELEHSHYPDVLLSLLDRRR